MTSSSAVGAGASVQPTPANFTPQIATDGTDGSVERIRQLTPCGANMYAAGTFTQVKQGSSVVTRNNVFSFSQTTGTITNFNPNVNGTVNSVALSPDCSVAYLGGTFSNIGGTAVKNIAAVSTSTGAVITSFASSAAAKVNNVEYVNGHVLVGGNFKSINNSSKAYLVSLNPSTGRDDGYVNLNISGNYVYTDLGGRQSSPNPTNVYNMTVSPDGSKVLVMGVFTSIGGAARRQIAMLDLGSSSASVDPWYSAEFDQNCATVEPFYVQAADWSPDMSKVYVATTGYKPATGSGYFTTNPRTGLCDAAAAFPASASSTQTHLWVNYGGCDSMYSLAADANTVYVGGHERWLSNLQCDNNNNHTAVVDPGMGGINPTTGATITAPGNPLQGLYVRGRGLGADDMVLTSAGLWIASDNAQNTSTCGGVSGKRGICFLPY